MRDKRRGGHGTDFFIGCFSKLFEFQSHLHAIWLHAPTHTQTHTEFLFCLFLRKTKSSQVAPGVKNPPTNAGDARDTGASPGLGDFPEVGNGNLLQCSWASPMAQQVK